jgi:hypothetical protein
MRWFRTLSSCGGSTLGAVALPRPDEDGGAFLPLWPKIAAAFVLAALATLVIPQTGGDGSMPGLSTLLATGAVVALVTTGALYIGLRRNLGLPLSIALYAVGYNVVVVLVKFVLGPRALYEVSEEGRLETLVDPSDPVSASLIALSICALYALALTVIYRLARRRLQAHEARAGGRRLLLIGLVTGVLLFASGGLPLVLAVGGLDYVAFVFSSSLSLLVGVALAGAVALAAATLSSTAERAQLVGDVALLTSVFWVGLAFLALYHALWVIYVLVLTSIWPLRVITPK